MGGGCWQHWTGPLMDMVSHEASWRLPAPSLRACCHLLVDDLCARLTVLGLPCHLQSGMIIVPINIRLY